jgi:hypothetical protein
MINIVTSRNNWSVLTMVGETKWKSNASRLPEIDANVAPIRKA